MTEIRCLSVSLGCHLEHYTGLILVFVTLTRSMLLPICFVSYFSPWVLRQKRNPMKKHGGMKQVILIPLLLCEALMFIRGNDEWKITSEGDKHC